MKQILFFGQVILFVLFSPKLFSQTNTFPGSGNVGIGTLSPENKLHVLGTRSNTITSANAISRIGGADVFIHFGALNGTPDYGAWLQVARPSDDLAFSLSLNPNGGYVGIGTTAPQRPLSVYGGGAEGQLRLGYSDNWYWELGRENVSTGRFCIRDRTTEVFSILTGGNVGIGTTTPGQKLEVKGNIYLTDATYGNILMVGGKTGTSYNFFFDTQQGNYLKLWTDGGSGYVVMDYLGNVGIGITNPQNKLDVNGTVHAREFKASLDGWSDFVFDKDYNLLSLKDVESYIKENNKLPDIPSAKEVIANGVNLGEMNALLFKKVEELTLYVIELSKKVEKLESEKTNKF